MIAERFQSEARARVIWGDSPEEVIAHLRSEGATLKEAEVAFEAVKYDRREFIQRAAKKKILLGMVLLPVPFVAFAIFQLLHTLPLKIFAFTVVIGLIGAWKLIRGILGTVRPDAIHGDLSDDSTE